MFAERSRREVDAIRLLLGEAAVLDGPAIDSTTPADERILSAILAGDQSTSDAHVSAKPHRRMVVRLAAAAAAIVAVTGAGIAWQALRQPAEAGPPPILHFADTDIATVLAGGGEAAHDALAQLAAVAATQPVTIGEGYQEITSWAWYMASTDQETVLSPTRQRVVVGPDGSVVNSESRGAALDLDGHVVDGDAPPGGFENVDELPPGTMDPSRTTDLPRDPEALRTAILAPMQGAGCEASDRAVAECLMRSASEIALFGVVPSDLSSALWLTLADEPAVVLLGSTTDRLGRAGRAVGVRTGVDGTQGLYVLVISPEDGRLLEWDEIDATAPDLGVEGPVLAGFQAFLTSRWIPRPEPGVTSVTPS